ARELERVQEVERQRVLDPEREVRERDAGQDGDPRAVLLVSGDELAPALERFVARVYARESGDERVERVRRPTRDGVAPVRTVQADEREGDSAAEREQPGERGDVV